MRLILGLYLVYLLSANAPPAMPGFIQFVLGFMVMYAVFATFRPKKEPEEDG